MGDDSDGRELLATLAASNCLRENPPLYRLWGRRNARTDDERFVARLYRYLRRRFDVWWDRIDMPSRSLSFLEETRRAIEGVDRVVVVIGPRAVASEYVRAEWLYAMAVDKPVVPILRAGRNPQKPGVRDYELLPAEMKNLHAPDFRSQRPFAEACGELVKKLREPLPLLGSLSAVE